MRKNSTPAKTERDDTLSYHHKFYRPWIVWTLRILVGILFMFSGFSKAVDPWGFIFKIEEYLGSWSMALPRAVIFISALGLCLYEFVLGFMLAVGAMRRLIPWLLLASMIVMLPLTGYIAITNNVEDCGCFGEALKLSNSLTFIKNILLTLLIIYLCCFNRRVKQSLYASSIQWIIGVLCVGYILVISLYGYNIQPLIDFRHFPEGLDLREHISDSEAENEDYLFKYEKNGEIKIFDMNNLPDDSWTFVERVTPIEEGLDTSRITIYDEFGDDVTPDVISKEGELLILNIPEPGIADISYSFYANEFNSLMIEKGGSFICLMGGGEQARDNWIDLSMASYPVYIVDDTILKEMCRGIISLIYLDDGVIQWKRTLSSIDFPDIEKLNNKDFVLSDLKIERGTFLITITAIFVSLLVLIALFQQAIMSIFSYFKRKNKKNNVNLQSK